MDELHRLGIRLVLWQIPVSKKIDEPHAQHAVPARVAELPRDRTIVVHDHDLGRNPVGTRCQPLRPDADRHVWRSQGRQLGGELALDLLR